MKKDDKRKESRRRLKRATALFRAIGIVTGRLMNMRHAKNGDYCHRRAVRWLGHRIVQGVPVELYRSTRVASSR